jgi:hypothetical protein
VAYTKAVLNAVIVGAGLPAMLAGKLAAPLPAVTQLAPPRSPIRGNFRYSLSQTTRQRQTLEQVSIVSIFQIKKANFL